MPRINSPGAGSLSSEGVARCQGEERRLFRRTPCSAFGSLEEALEEASEDEGFTRTAAPQGSTDGAQFRFRVYHRSHIAIRCSGARSSWILSEWPARQLCALLRFPFAALDKLLPATCVEVLHDRCLWGFKEQAKLAEKYHRYLVPLVTERDVTPHFSLPRLRAINSIMYDRMSDASLLQFLVEEQDSFHVERVTRGERSTQVWMRNIYCQDEVGDEVVSPGIMVRSSEVGCGLLEVWRMIYRHRDGAMMSWSGEQGQGRLILRCTVDRHDWLQKLRGDFAHLRNQRSMPAELKAALKAQQRLLGDDAVGVVSMLKHLKWKNHRRRSAATAEPSDLFFTKAVKLAEKDDAYGGELTAWNVLGAMFHVGQKELYNDWSDISAKLAPFIIEP